LSLFAPNMKQTDTETGHCGPECEEEQHPRTDWIGVRVRPQAHLGEKNDDEQGTRFDHEKPEADLHEPVFRYSFMADTCSAEGTAIL